MLLLSCVVISNSPDLIEWGGCYVCGGCVCVCVWGGGGGSWRCGVCTETVSQCHKKRIVTRLKQSAAKTKNMLATCNSYQSGDTARQGVPALHCTAQPLHG